MIRKEILILIDGILKENKKRKVHIVLSTGRFYNGFVVNYSDEESLSFVDDKLGYINILYSQILNVEPFVEKYGWINNSE